MDKINSSNSKVIKTGSICEYNSEIVKMLSVYENSFEILYSNGKTKYAKGLIDELPIYKSDKEFKLDSSNLTLTIHTQSAQIVAQALELYTRLNLGQLHELHNLFCDKSYDIEALEYALTQTKIILFPELQSNESYGIYNNKVKNDVKVAYDIYKEIQHKLCDNQDNVHYSKPLQASDVKINVEVK